ncbi:hypothetical protein [Tengunoibacter tsumagoiensis]|uniref:Uncharacterized protein n=1 Tax=Tengunoibacter tsumagoiensis TaxID=2014871 RepID=A0A401ZTX2_9CHLR|nr:hypothetical protein [Tengunoibacter tsumagoiensis]GCE10262.1 hypothetical protein KTT_01210 [Tengunoibacter tsumagoiensis]
MSNDFPANTTTNRYRRTRVPRHRPVLVTGNETEDQNLAVATEDLATEEPTTGALEAPVVAIETPASKRANRLPNFFSKVAKTEEEVSPKEEEVVQARMARAKGAKKVAARTEIAAEAARDEEKFAAKPKKEAPPRIFKTKHIFGMMAYLLVAEFVLPYESLFATRLGIEKTLFTLPLFGTKLPFTVSFLINIITLLLLLYVLVQLDLLPRSLSGAAQNARNTAKGGSKTEVTEKTAPPVMRQGVQGEHDDLYRAYRSNQRRKK